MKIYYFLDRKKEDEFFNIKHFNKGRWFNGKKLDLLKSQ